MTTRSAPTSLGLSYRIWVPVRTPGPIINGLTPRYCSHIATNDMSRVGTTLEMTTLSIWWIATFAVSNSPTRITPSSSAVESRRVESRHWCASSSPAKAPMAMLVLPASMARSIR